MNRQMRTIKFNITEEECEVINNDIIDRNLDQSLHGWCRQVISDRVAALSTPVAVPTSLHGDINLTTPSLTYVTEAELEREVHNLMEQGKQENRRLYGEVGALKMDFAQLGTQFIAVQERLDQALANGRQEHDVMKRMLGGLQTDVGQLTHRHNDHQHKCEGYAKYTTPPEV
jgi:hypothetical protein